MFFLQGEKADRLHLHPLNMFSMLHNRPKDYSTNNILESSQNYTRDKI